MCNCTDEVWIGQPDSQRTVDAEVGSCVDDTGCSTVVMSERHISEWRTERAIHHWWRTERATHHGWRTERAIHHGWRTEHATHHGWGTERETHHGRRTERATHHGWHTERAAHHMVGILSVQHITGSIYRNERVVKNDACVTVHCGMCSEGL